MMAMMQLLTLFVSLFVIGFLAGYGTPAMVSNQKGELTGGTDGPPVESRIIVAKPA
jgi:hypothetical protein